MPDIEKPEEQKICEELPSTSPCITIVDEDDRFFYKEARCGNLIMRYTSDKQCPT